MQTIKTYSKRAPFYNALIVQWICAEEQRAELSALCSFMPLDFSIWTDYGPVTLTTAFVSVPLPAGELHVIFTLFVRPWVIGRTLVSAQLTTPSEEATDII